MATRTFSDGAALRPRAGRRPGARRFDAATVLRWSSPLLILALWQLLSATGVLTPDKLAAPTTIFNAAGDLLANGQLSDAVLTSLRRAVLGFLLGAAIGLGLGFLAGAGRWGEAAVDPPMQMVRTLPLFGLVPLFIIWFGIGEWSKITLIALGVMVPLYLNTLGALKGVDRDLFEVADTLRLSRWERFRHVLLPGALPGILVGLRQSLGIAWLALVVAEQIAAGSGLGYMINNARDFQQTDVVVVGLLAYAILGLLTDWAVRGLEKRALRWRDGQEVAA